jgi:hypothetical protein
VPRIDSSATDKKKHKADATWPRRAILAATTRAYFFFATAAGGVGADFFWSPITPLSGQILNAGHLAQPAAMAIGHRVMRFSWVSVMPTMASPRRQLSPTRAQREWLPTAARGGRDAPQIRLVRHRRAA